MAMTNNYGLSYADKNRIRRYHESGMDMQAIASRLRCTVELASRYIRSQSKPKAAPTPAPKQADDFGPLPDSPEWQELMPAQKAQISRKRNAA